MIAIISACGSNFNSVQFALERLGKASVITDQIKEINQASHLILPGVGTANQAMDKLKQKKLIEFIQHTQKPVLGICLGMQLLFEKLEEGNCQGLAVIPGIVKHFYDLDFKFKKHSFPVPHMGWNEVKIKNSFKTSLLKNISNSSMMYFVHSYAAPITPYTQATCDYGTEFSCVVSYRNFHGVQFHPERSGKAGATLLKNFLTME